jgi:hypothetical protein
MNPTTAEVLGEAMNVDGPRRDEEGHGLGVPQLTAVIDEVLQHRECLGPQGDGLVGPPQPLVRWIEPERAEGDLLTRRHYRNMTAT